MRFVELEQSELARIDETKLISLKKRLTVEYRIAALRGRKDYCWWLGERISDTEMELFSRAYERELPKISSFFRRDSERLKEMLGQ